MDRQSEASRVLRIIARRKWVVVECLVLVLGIALLLSVISDKRYESRAQVLLNYDTAASQLTGVQSAVPAQAERIAETQAKLARVPVVLDRVVEAVAVPGVTAGTLAAQSSVTAQGNADLLDFRVQATDPTVSRRLATEYATQFTKYRAELDTAAVRRALQDLRSQLSNLRSTGQQSTPLYQTYSQKEQELRTLEALQTSRATVVREASDGSQVRPPSLRALLGVGGLIGLAVGVIAALSWDALDRRLRTGAEVSEVLGQPVLAEIPANTRRGKDTGLVMLRSEDGPDAEVFRILRASIDLMNVDVGARVVMVTSAASGEGKSTTIANLAVAEARAGRRVAVVDLDVRRPAIARLFGHPAVPGVTDVAVGTASLDEAMVRIECGGNEGGALLVLPAGVRPPDASEFVSRRVVREMLASVAERVDLVLVDAPPMLVVSDPRSLSGSVDGILTIVRLDRSDRRQQAALREVLDSIRVPKLGVALTATSRRGGHYSQYTYGTADGAERTRTGAGRAAR